MFANRLVRLSGGPRERGRQHGEILKSEIKDLHATFMDLMLTGLTRAGAPKMSTEVIVDYVRQHVPHMEAGAHDLYEEIKGIADGAGLGVDAVMTLTCVAEARRIRGPGVLDAIGRQVALEASSGCTCFAVQGRSPTMTALSSFSRTPPAPTTNAAGCAPRSTASLRPHSPIAAKCWRLPPAKMTISTAGDSCICA